MTSVLRFAADQLAGAYCPVAGRARPGWPGCGTWQAGCWRGAEPGSDRQLTAFRLLVRCDDDADRLRGWAEGAATAGRA